MLPARKHANRRLPVFEGIQVDFGHVPGDDTSKTWADVQPTSSQPKLGQIIFESPGILHWVVPKRNGIARPLLSWTAEGFHKPVLRKCVFRRISDSNPILTGQ
jgi:hypothetical protein